MSTYLLLRSNKESGPFTIEEIREMSLKAYDLVWVVGKSAAWRYPGEVPEFKSFAPAVPEQTGEFLPRKNNGETLKSDPAQNKKTESQHFLARESNASRLSASHSVYVNLPAEKKPSVVSPAGVLYDSDFHSVQEPVHDFSDIYSKKPSRAVRISGRLIWIFSILLLFGTGILTGFFISDRRKFFTTDANHPQITPSVQPAALQAKKDNSSQANNLLSGQPAGGITPNDPSQKSVPVALGKTGSSFGKRDLKKNIKKDSLSSTALTAPVSHAADSTQHQNLPGNTELLYQKVRANPENYISVTAGRYTKGIFGGISSVPVSVTNNSPVILDLVIITVDYIQNNDKVYKTESISFNDLEPGETLTEKAPKSSRGVKITTRVHQISSRKLDLNYSN